jgi:hypothetical protein
MNPYINQSPLELVKDCFGWIIKSSKTTWRTKIFWSDTFRRRVIACKRKPCVLSLNKKLVKKYIYHLFTDFQVSVEHHRTTTFEMTFHKKKPGESVWFRTPRSRKFIIYEIYSIFEIKKTMSAMATKNIHKLLTPRSFSLLVYGRWVIPVV